MMVTPAHIGMGTVAGAPGRALAPFEIGAPAAGAPVAAVTVACFPAGIAAGEAAIVPAGVVVIAHDGGFGEALFFEAALLEDGGELGKPEGGAFERAAGAFNHQLAVG